MEKLYTTKQIAEMYEVSAYTITQNWCNKGLKFLRGKHSLLFKEKWIEDFLEEESLKQSQARIFKPVKRITNKTIRRNFNTAEMKIV